MQVDWMLATDLLVDVFFLCDIALNFHTGYIRDQAFPLPSTVWLDHQIWGS